MSGRRHVTWGEARAYFLAHGYEIVADGGDKVIIAPKTDTAQRRTRAPVRIGHHCCTRDGDELGNVHLTRIKLAFGVTRKDLLGDL